MQFLLIVRYLSKGKKSRLFSQGKNGAWHCCKDKCDDIIEEEGKVKSIYT
jgi:hypothetical protein